MPLVSLIDTVTKHRNGDFSGAADDYQKLLSTDPDNTDILNLYGLCLNNLNQFDCAIPLFTKAISLAPGQNEYLQNRGAAYVGMGRFDVALSDFQNAISLAPQNIFLLVKTGELSLMLDMHDGAAAYFQKALTIDPENSEARNGLAFTLNKLGISDLNNGSVSDAIQNFSEAIELAPDNWELHYNLGNAFLKSDQFQEAKTAFEHSIKLNQSSVQAYSNYGISCERLGHYNKALNAYNRALDICPTHSDTLFNKSLILLKQGNYKDGFRLYEERWNTTAFEKHKRKFTAPLWLGEQTLDNKTILLHAEQGFGDTIQFARFCKYLNHKTCNIIVECPTQLVEIFQTLDIDANFITKGSQLPPFDFHCPLMSLPFSLGLSSPRDFCSPPYLKVPKTYKIKWQSIFKESERLRIGLVFEGSPTHQNNHFRSLPVNQALDYLPVGPDYFLLQKETSSGLLLALKTRDDVSILNEKLQNFADTAAVCKHMDIIFSVDTAVAHLAGALGIQTILMLHHQSDWRWLLSTSKTHWYSNVTIFRGNRSDGWLPALNNANIFIKSKLYNAQF